VVRFSLFRTDTPFEERKRANPEWAGACWFCLSMFPDTTRFFDSCLSTRLPFFYRAPESGLGNHGAKKNIAKNGWRPGAGAWPSAELPGGNAPGTYDFALAQRRPEKSCGFGDMAEETHFQELTSR